ncbi:helix-turn-helix domain-containing protein [Paenibacillus antri]|uniref:Helix-turn-helix domain-containing protein n=1 Tax=Paenibacillus antri TaxID=2582848 RepID=A0A5R9G856_9BACL|nr:AraC family transcriptional regulator [Paenibacillus antri]TLS50260.1 helix-turn-helix domain-containing protein [Paenibacillus antri]
MEFRLSAGGANYAIEHVTTNVMRNRRNEAVAMHRHPVFHLIYVLEGKGKVTVGGTETTAAPGLLYIINPNVPHSFLFGDGEPLTDLECTFRLLDEREEPAEVDFFDLVETSRGRRLPEEFRSQPFRVPERMKPLLTEGFERVLELYRSPLTRGSLALAVADLLSRAEAVAFGASREEEALDSSEALIDSVKQFLQANRGRPVTLGETADFAHMTPNYLCRVFKERTGETPMGYLQAARMREAEKLLALTDLPVYTIAEKLGYEEPSYFARVFRRATGESPQAFRKRLLARNRIK